MISSTRRHPWRALLLAACMAAIPALAAAQNGTVRGTVAGPDGDAIRSAQVTVVGTPWASSPSPASPPGRGSCACRARASWRAPRP
jgi:hypothetical protein